MWSAREIGEGLRYLFGDGRWRATTTFSAMFNSNSGIMTPLILVYAVRHWGPNAGELGLALMLGNIGWLGGAVVAGRTARVLGLGRTLSCSAARSAARPSSSSRCCRRRFSNTVAIRP